MANQPGFTLGYFRPPINYGDQFFAVGRGGPNMPANSFARHMNAWPPRWAATMLANFSYPYGTASSLDTVPAFPNLWTAYGMPVNNVVKMGTSKITF